MAINKIDQPGSTAPTLNTDYTQQNLINVGSYMIGPAILTGWADTGTEPDIENGTYISYGGNIYQVQGGDESISGTMTEGVNYVILTTPDSGSTLTAAWGDDLTGYVYNEAYQGLYNTGALAVQAICNKDGAVYTRGLYHNTTLTGAVYYSDNDSVIDGNLDVSGDITAPSFLGTATNAENIVYDTTGTFLLSSRQDYNLYSVAGEGIYMLSSGPSDYPTIPGDSVEHGVYFITSTITTINLGSGYWRYWRFGG